MNELNPRRRMNEIEKRFMEGIAIFPDDLELLDWAQREALGAYTQTRARLLLQAIRAATTVRRTEAKP